MGTRPAGCRWWLVMSSRSGRGEGAVVGVGLNVAVRVDELPVELHDRAGTLGLGPEAIEPTLGRLLERLEHWIAARAEQVLKAVRARDALRGQQVQWADGEGQAAGIDGDGRLS